MEEYLQNLRSLRSQMNDIEEVAAKKSVEEQRQKTAIEALEKDLFSVASETTRISTESEDLEKEKAQICQQIFEKQKKISSFENETSTLSQSLELLRQQAVTASAGLEEKRMYFAKITEDFVFKLQQGHDRLKSYKLKMIANPREEMSTSYKKLITQVESKKNEYEELKIRKSQLHDEIAESKELMAQLELKKETFSPALRTLDMEALLEEHKALLADESGELEYLKSLEDQIKQVKVYIILLSSFSPRTMP
ncbi:intracellular protein transport protein USO1 [Phalaenopsis equestris]|uniref:intracellular protein transport protein USO1 n=1 Tax=Phalaenopsis equestris TaxID=78828 RepID=UPI0009E28567|nr:intracellular protein transport protein USO1 [Phalaenopsis equestris]